MYFVMFSVKCKRSKTKACSGNIPDSIRTIMVGVPGLTRDITRVAVKYPYLFKLNGV